MPQSRRRGNALEDAATRATRAHIVVALFFVFLTGPAVAAWDGAWQDKMFGKSWELSPASGEVVVRYEATAGEAVREAVRSAHGLSVLHEYNASTGVVHYGIPVGSDAELVAAALSEEFGVAGALPAMVDHEGYRKYMIPGRVTVQFRKDLSEPAYGELISSSGSEVVRDYWTPGYYTLTVPGGMTEIEAVRMWQGHGSTLFSEPSYMVYDDLAYVPNDPFYEDQWALNNTGDYGGGTPGADVEAEAAWDLERGDPDIIVVIIDTGVELGHEDLAPNLLFQASEDWDFSGDGQSPDDENGHGTAVAGIACAVQDNGLGVSGIAPGCRFMPLKVNLLSGQNENRADAINYATSRRPEFKGMVINGSWLMSSGDFTSVEAACQNAWNSDVVLCFAAGNQNEGQIPYPAAYTTTIAVGATSPCDERKSPTSCDGESSWGSNYGLELDVVAPGVKIYTTDLEEGGFAIGKYVPYFNGTSSATPLVTGICALIWSGNPNLSNAQVRQILRETAEDQVGPPGEDSPGWDQYFGYGRVNAGQALDRVIPSEAADGMEVPSGWTHKIVYPQLGFGDEWHLSTERNHTTGGQFSWKCGSDQGGDYGTEISAAAISPRYNVLPSSVLTFWHWMDVYSPSEGIAGDGAKVEASSDSGYSWLILLPAGGYTHEWPHDGQIPFWHNSKVFSGTFDWRRETFILPDILVGPVNFRFRFGTRGEAPTGEGWYIDDLVISSETSGAPDVASGPAPVSLLPARPNPAPGSTNLRFLLESPVPVRITVHDVAGRLIRAIDLGTRPAGAHAVRFDGLDGRGRTLPSGVYLYRLAAGTSQRTGRFVLLD